MTWKIQKLNNPWRKTWNKLKILNRKSKNLILEVVEGFNMYDVFSEPCILVCLYRNSPGILTLEFIAMWEVRGHWSKQQVFDGATLIRCNSDLAVPFGSSPYLAVGMDIGYDMVLQF